MIEIGSYWIRTDGIRVGPKIVKIIPVGNIPNIELQYETVINYNGEKVIRTLHTGFAGGRYNRISNFLLDYQPISEKDKLELL